ncbi:MAG: hypothetical protein methR_P1472 [Methyloprofundus sp.]|nr:MAG: hypothetical protein methR_P1472 [Methyloprofundus sp.]
MQFLESMDVRSFNKNSGWFFFFFFTSSITIFSLSIFNSSHFDFYRVCYVVIFFNISALPFFFMDKSKGRYVLMVIFLPLYFVLFCIGDFFSILGIEDKLAKETKSIESAVDGIIIIGGVCYIFGYMFLISITKKKWKGWFSDEWDFKKIKIAGVLCWMLGTWAFITIFFFKETSQLPLSIVSNLKNFSLIGVIMLTYHYLSKNDKSTLFILLFIGGGQLFLGFVANTKEVSFIIPVVYLIIGFISKGRINKKILVSLVALMVVYISFFNVYRLFVMQINNKTPLQAVQSLSQSIDTVLSNLNTKHVDNKKKSSSFLKERIETRKYIIILVNGIEKGVPTMDGYTLNLFFKSFIPRVFWPNKPEISIGKLFNHEFNISASKLTYIPATHLGEFYWNFKMPGVVVGMFFIGFFMAYISKMTDLSVKVTLPRVIIIMMVIYITCVRFEADWAQQYSNVVRALVIIYFLNLFLRKKVKKSNPYYENLVDDK